MRIRKGFTLIEVLIAMGITLAVLTYALVNYYRSSNDSALQRETSLLMARLRFAQQETASGKTFNYCYHFTGMTCTGNGNTVKVCDNDPTKRCNTVADCGGALCDSECDGKQCCPNGVGGSGPCPAGHETPDGGFALTFSCEANLPPDGLHTYPLFELAKSRYALFAERRACVYTDNCFPPRYTAFNDSLISSDGIISSMFYVGSNYNRLKGDTVQEQYTVNADVEIADLQITALNAISPTSGPPKQSFHCGDDSPWEGVRVHTIDPSSSIVPNNYPIQAAIRFAPPDGQEVFITDNVSITPPPYSANPTNAWVKAEVMLKLKRRGSDCRVISITRAGVISERNDADCNITTSS